jgi:2-oxo-3-(phosphooxy)propyl 3-oxoalkanoate synthase
MNKGAMADNTAKAIRALSFDATVPRHLVHKRGIDEVLITDSIAIGATSFVCAGHLPRSHRTYAPTGGAYHDLLLLAELTRQAGFVGAHRHLGAALDRHFVFRSAALMIDDLDACERRTEAMRAVVETTVADPRHVDGAVYDACFEAHISINGRDAAHETASGLLLGPEDYREMRGAATAITSGALERPDMSGHDVDPAVVGRTEATQVVISSLQRPTPDAASATILVDPAHPSFFDHPLDHVPAMLLLEAGRQTAVAAAFVKGARPPLVLGYHARFFSFANLDRPLICDASLASDRAAVTVAIRQQSTAVGEYVFDLGPGQ